MSQNKNFWNANFDKFDSIKLYWREASGQLAGLDGHIEDWGRELWLATLLEAADELLWLLGEERLVDN